MSRQKEAEYRARRVLEKQFRIMDAEERRKMPKRPEVKGPRAKFLAKYRQEGYEAAKVEIHLTETGKKAFPEEVLKTWIEQEKE